MTARHIIPNIDKLKARLAEAAAQAKQTGKRVRINDGDGLMLVVRSNGEASWDLRYRLNGKRLDITLGRWPTLTLALARGEADKARKLKATGTDPMATRAAKREEAATMKVSSKDTVQALMDEWMAHPVYGKGRLTSVARGNIEAAFKRNVLEKIGSRAPHEVTRDDIERIIVAIEVRGALETARRVRMWLRQMFEFGATPALSDRPLLTMSPVGKGMTRTVSNADKNDKRNFPAITDPNEAAELMRKIMRTTDNVIIRNALLFSAHTFQRPGEIRAADWSEFDLKARRWNIPAARMKSRVAHWVPLSDQVMKLLAQHAGLIGDEGLLFPGRKYAMPISEGTLTGRLNNMGFKDKHSPHGFRAMASTILQEQLGVDKRVVELQLAHTFDDTHMKGAYDRTKFVEARAAMMQRWSDWLDSAIAAPALSLAA